MKPLQYEKQYTMIITNKNYIVPIILNSTELSKGITDAKELCLEMKATTRKIIWSNQNKMSIEPIDEWLEHIVKDFHKLEEQANDFLTTKFPHYKNNRQKRAYINAIGDISKTLFGTATEADIEEIHGNIDKLQLMSEENHRIRF